MNPSSQPGAGIGYNFSLGDRIGGGRYLLKRLLGRGQCSEVWLAQDIRDVKPVALKFLPPAFLSDANLIERLRQDAQRLVLLKHPHIVTTYDFVQDYSTIAIASEFIDGWSLATLKVDKPGNCYSVAEIEPWMQQLCDALAYAHSDIGIIHSDLKPANLLITAKEELKVSDFELANLVRLECSRRGIAKGLNAGLGFLSPQRALGEAPSKLDDIYSLGATIFDLFTGTPPFYKGEIFAQICSLKAPSISARIKELNLQYDPIPPVWEDTVARCLEKNPADRPQSIGAFLDLLKRTELPKPTPIVRAIPPVLPPVLLSPATPPVIPEPSIASTEATNPPVTSPQTPAPLVSDSTPIVRPLASPPPGAPARAPSAKTAILLFTVVILLLAVIAGAAVFFALRQGAKSAAHLITNAITNSIAIASTQTGSAGSLDQTFATGDGASDEVHAFAVQPDGKILVGGKFVTFNGAPHHGIVRLNPDGSIDTSFTHQTPNLVNSVAIQPDGKIFIAGASMIKGHPGSRILRLNQDSSVDKSFKYGLGFNGDVRTIMLQPDGQILAGGNFTVIARKPQNHLVRLAPGAALDDAFDANIAFPAAVFSLALQPDGKIIVVGLFTSSTDAKANHIIRLNPDGTADPQFNSGSGADNNVIAIALQADGAILIGGNFTAVNQRSFPHLARLNPDGTVDTTFNIGAGPEKAVQTIAVQPDGKILIGGDFSTYQGEPCSRIARLNPDGSLDKTFDSGAGANGMIQTLVLQPDGKILIGGDFTSFNNVPCNHIARLNNSFAAK